MKQSAPCLLKVNITYLFFITVDKIINGSPNFLKFTTTRLTFGRLLSEPLSVFVKIQFNIPDIDLKKITVVNSR
jgi:hypothetical protein